MHKPLSEYKVGDKVEILYQGWNSNPGDIGTITTDWKGRQGSGVHVTVEGVRIGYGYSSSLRPANGLAIDWKVSRV